MSLAHCSWSPVASTERPMIFVFRLSNSGLICAMYPSSVVQTGVKSLGWEKRTAHESPIQSWNLLFPSVVSASRPGAVSPSCKVLAFLLEVTLAGNGSRRDLPKERSRQLSE